MTNKRPSAGDWDGCFDRREATPLKKRATGAPSPGPSSPLIGLDYKNSDNVQSPYAGNTRIVKPAFPISPAYSNSTEVNNGLFLPAPDLTNVLEGPSLANDCPGFGSENPRVGNDHGMRLCFGMVRITLTFSVCAVDNRLCIFRSLML
jgi:hypothetical protein